MPNQDLFGPSSNRALGVLALALLLPVLLAHFGDGERRFHSMVSARFV